MPGRADDEGRAVTLARRLRATGIGAPTDATITFARALAAVDRGDRGTVYWAARATLVNRPDDVEAFDVAFAGWWDGDDAGGLPDDAPDDGARPAGAHGGTVRVDRAAAGDVGLAGDATPGRGIRLATYDAGERAHASALMRRLRDAGEPRRSPRRRPARRGSRPDLRATVRAAARTGGEPIEQPRRRRLPRPRRVVLLLDVSRSMEPYARSLLRFVHAAVAGRRHVEAFAMGTRLTHLTRELATRDPARALARATERVDDWSGGTRLGACLRRFNDEWGIRGMARGSIVIVMSDGWERGDPTELGAQVARVHRVAHSVIWVNPVAAAPGYVPLARGLGAAMPHVDHLVAGHSGEALERLLGIMGDVTTDRTATGGTRARAAG
jgi:uncharacterized protein with von Willebrand factor type A (vWA) domain